MNMTKTRLHLATVLGLSLLLGACAIGERSRNLADPAVPAAMLAEQVCSICHGVDGNPVSPTFPRLAGQSAAYLSGELQAFRSHQRSDRAARDYMWGISRTLNDATIGALADYYARQVPARARSVAGVSVSTGEQLFHHGDPEHGIPACAGCHGERGQGSAVFPRIAGQQDGYLRQQMRQIRLGSRAAPSMQAVVARMDDAQIDALADFLAVQP